ncbi:MAG: SdrD B-like domain-containing protein [Candidatus Levybacteria bacterium]|nr:SdrD B-like domain-containing protein [Candidatus Levybacteria bacterium]
MLEKIKELIASAKESKILNLVVLLLIVAVIPLTVIIAQKQQETRQRASNDKTKIEFLDSKDNIISQTNSQNVRVKLTYVVPSPPSPSPSPAPSEVKSLSLGATATTSFAGFKKYLYSFPLPSPVNFVGLSGNASIDSSSPMFSEALITLVDLPSGNCPANGSVYNTYEEIYQQYPGVRIISQFILKNSISGSVQTPTEFTLPAGVPLNGCLFIMLDGGVPTGGTLKMTSNMIFKYTTDPPVSPTPYIIGFNGTEICFGQNWGCQRAIQNASEQNAFINITPVGTPLKLLSLFGNISDAAYTGTPYANPPTGNWNVINDFYIYKECSQFQTGLSGPKDYYATIPSDAIHLLNVSMSGNGRAAVHQAVSKSFDNLILSPNDCFAYLIKANANGGIGAESQVMALVQPVSAQSTLISNNFRIANSQPELVNAQAQAFNGTEQIIDWVLSSGDGTKTVYVQFQINGAWQDIVSANIDLAGSVAITSTPVPAQHSIVGKIWIDSNKNGLYDATADANFVGGTIVTLKNLSTSATTTATTSTADGNYYFFNLPNGQYSVTLPPVSGYELTLPNNTNPITVNIDHNSPQYSWANFSVTQLPPIQHSIVGKIWIDSNKNGLYDASIDANYLGGATVTLKNFSTLETKTITTGTGDGNYYLWNLPKGKYSITLSPVSCYTITTPNNTNPVTVNIDDNSQQYSWANFSVAPIATCVPIYRFINMKGQHYYTPNKSEANYDRTHGWMLEGTVFYAFNSSGSDSSLRPVYWLYNPINNDNFFTISSSQRDIALRLGKLSYTLKGVKFYAYPTSKNNAVPVYRLLHKEAGHFYTINASERDSAIKQGYAYEGIEFYAFTSK